MKTDCKTIDHFWKPISIRVGKNLLDLQACSGCGVLGLPDHAFDKAKAAQKNEPKTNQSYTTSTHTLTSTDMTDFIILSG